VENCSIGIFKTALHQVAKIKNFKFTSNSYTDSTSKSTVDDSLRYLPFRHSPKEQIRTYAGLLSNKLNRWGVSFDIDSFNISGLIFDGFDYAVFSDDVPVLSIKCSRAEISYDTEGIELRGHVEIRAGDTKIIKANHINWDYDNRKFIVKSVYALRKDNFIETGRSIVLDYELERSSPDRRTDDKNKEDGKCLAKMQLL
jgi:hypothetical protein